MSELTWEGEDLRRFTKEKFDEFLLWSFDNGASDIFIEAGAALAVKVDGAVAWVGQRVVSYEEVAEILIEIDQHASPTLIKSGEELNFRYAVLREISPTEDELVRFRVNATGCEPNFGSKDGVEIVIRTIPATVPHHKDLGIPEEIIKACDSKFGIMLMTGPTGSGKSTSIAAMLRHVIETRPQHLITYESPIEFNLKSIENPKALVIQTEVPGNLTDYRVATANSLRRAPDILLFGEGRDKETISACIRESQTGHLVFSTIHTNDVSGTITRMVDEFDPSERRGTTAKLIDALRGIIHQRLYPRLSGGRIAIREYLLFTDAMRRHLQMCLLNKDDISSDIRELLVKEGKPLLEDAKSIFRSGNIDLGVYASIVIEVGDTDVDMGIVPEVAASLHSNGTIDKETFDSWIKEYEENHKQ